MTEPRTIFDRLMELWELPWSEEHYGEAQLLLARVNALVDGMAGPRIVARPKAAAAQALDLIRELVDALDKEIALHPYDADVPTTVLAARDKARAYLDGAG